MRIIIDTTPVSGTASRRVSKEYVRQRQREGLAFLAREKRLREEYLAKQQAENTDEEKKSDEE
ncbi:MAG TPA: hypothetical protein VI306_23460 [Pyrinomonadaceae bacterium]